MLLAENQVIERNIEHLPAGNVLLLDLLPDDALNEFSQQRPDINWFGFTPFVDTYDKFKTSKFDVSFGHWFESEHKFDAVIIYYPKTKLRFDYYLSNISKYLHEDATIYVVGEKKGGVKSCEKQIKLYSPKANKLDAARHCQLYSAWFNGDACAKQVDDWFSVKNASINVSQQNIDLTLYSLPGVFSASGIDGGTELLLTNLEPVKGHGIDFGCGCGIIAAATCKRFEASMTAVDVDAFAIASSNQTFKANKVNAKAVASNGLSSLPTNEKFDFVVTNPPFHTGIKTDYDITQTFIKDLTKILQNKFTLWMVANSFLPYQDAFKRYLKPAQVKTNNKRFTLYYLEK